jgi:hypothetical protein
LRISANRARGIATSANRKRLNRSYECVIDERRTKLRPLFFYPNNGARLAGADRTTRHISDQS